MAHAGQGMGVTTLWGKIIGAMAGFAMGGPFGAMMGAAFGHAAEEGLSGKAGAFSGFGSFSGGFIPQVSFRTGRREQLFAIAVVVLAAKTAKIDGPIKRVEIDTFKRVFRIPPEAVRDIGHLFDQARDSREDPLRYAGQLGQAFADSPGTLEDVLTALFAIAAADGPVNARERELLAAIARGFGLDRPAWERASGQRAQQRSMPDGEDDPYAVLGIARSSSAEDARAAWKKLVRENHPDVLASQGAAADLVAKAGEKVARINAAWDRIKRDRAP
jgi:DnaJ like chaperone protein